MNRVPIAILTAMSVLCQCAGETNMAEVAALQTKIHDLEKEIKRLSAQMKTEKYGLRWVECPEAFEAESENKIPILAEVPICVFCQFEEDQHSRDDQGRE